MANQLTEKEKKVSIKKIATLFTKLPRDEFLSVERTYDQIKEFIGKKFQYLVISAFWRSKYQTGDEPEILEFLTDDETAFFWEMTLWFDGIWNLILMTFSEIKKHAKTNKINFPFRKPYDLFVQIAIFHADNELEHCQTPYVEVSRKREREIIRLCSVVSERESMKLTADEIEKLDRLFKKSRSPKNPWLSLAMEVWRESKSTTVQREARSLIDKSNGILKKVKAYNFKKKSYSWQNGEKLEAQGRQGYRVP